VQVLKTLATSIGAGGARAWWSVALLAVLYIFSGVDRMIPAIIIGPLKADLGLSDLQIGLLIGSAFALFYSVLGLPLGRLVDKSNRCLIILCGVLLWGLCTAGSGFAKTFTSLVFLRIGLAIGEAVLTPAAYSIIGDLLPPSQRSLAASLYATAGTVGIGLTYVFGAAVVQVGAQLLKNGIGAGLGARQLVFLAAGVPPVLVVLVFALTVREPARSVESGPSFPSLGEVLRYVRGNFRLYGGMFTGAGLIQAIYGGFATWGPEYLRRAFAWSIQDAGYAFGIAILAAGATGPMFVPMLTRALESIGRRDSIVLVSAGCGTLGAALQAAAALQSSPFGFLVLFALGSCLALGATTNVMVAMQVIAPSRMRGTLVAALIMCMTLLGVGIGAPGTALISGQLSATGAALGAALAILAGVAGLISLFLLLWSRKSLLALVAVARCSP
jgi:predicted MFS family arabinose efflux permease